jgi:hypothetical protein
VRHDTRHNLAIVVLSIRVASQANRSSKSRVSLAPGERHAFDHDAVSRAAQAAEHSAQSTCHTPRLRCRHVEATGRVS